MVAVLVAVPLALELTVGGVVPLAVVVAVRLAVKVGVAVRLEVAVAVKVGVPKKLKQPVVPAKVAQMLEMAVH